MKRTKGGKGGHHFNGNGEKEMHAVSFIGDTVKLRLEAINKEASLMNCLANVVILTSFPQKGVRYNG